MTKFALLSNKRSTCFILKMKAWSIRLMIVIAATARDHVYPTGSNYCIFRYRHRLFLQQQAPEFVHTTQIPALFYSCIPSFAVSLLLYAKGINHLTNRIHYIIRQICCFSRLFRQVRCLNTLRFRLILHTVFRLGTLASCNRKDPVLLFWATYSPQ